MLNLLKGKYLLLPPLAISLVLLITLVAPVSHSQDQFTGSPGQLKIYYVTVSPDRCTYTIRGNYFGAYQAGLSAVFLGGPGQSLPDPAQQLTVLPANWVFNNPGGTPIRPLYEAVVRVPS